MKWSQKIKVLQRSPSDGINENMFKIREFVNKKHGEIEEKLEERFNEFQTKTTDIQNMYLSLSL